MPLPQTQRYSCQSCVTAQARWILGLSHATGRAAVREADELTGRKEGRPVSAAFSVPSFLAAGCEVIRYGKPDIDLDRLRRDGLPYFREYYADEWQDGEDDAFWTPRRLAAYAARAARELSALTTARAQYPELLAEAARAFTIGDADRLLADGCVIMTTYVPEGAAPDECHATLLHGRETDRFGEIYNAYNPGRGYSGIMFFRRDQFARMLRPYAYAIRRSPAVIRSPRLPAAAA
jgi:hypothetical protein